MRYVVHTDGGARGNPGVAGYGFVVRGEDGDIRVQPVTEADPTRIVVHDETREDPARSR